MNFLAFALFPAMEMQTCLELLFCNCQFVINVRQNPLEALFTCFIHFVHCSLIALKILSEQETTSFEIKVLPLLFKSQLFPKEHRFVNSQKVTKVQRPVEILIIV